MFEVISSKNSGSIKNCESKEKKVFIKYKFFIFKLKFQIIIHKLFDHANLNGENCFILSPSFTINLRKSSYFEFKKQKQKYCLELS